MVFGFNFIICLIFVLQNNCIFCHYYICLSCTFLHVCVFVWCCWCMCVRMLLKLDWYATGGPVLCDSLPFSGWLVSTAGIPVLISSQPCESQSSVCNKTEAQTERGSCHNKQSLVPEDVTPLFPFGRSICMFW